MHPTHRAYDDERPPLPQLGAGFVRCKTMLAPPPPQRIHGLAAADPSAMLSESLTTRERIKTMRERPNDLTSERATDQPNNHKTERPTAVFCARAISDAASDTLALLRTP